MGVNKDRKRYGCVGVVITLGMFLCACGKKEEEKNLGIGKLLVPTGNKLVQEESGTKENAVKAPVICSAKDFRKKQSLLL